eukprot:GSChrysophyteH1.ASY1.ANO1.3057.1 assembled CDS
MGNMKRKVQWFSALVILCLYLLSCERVYAQNLDPARIDESEMKMLSGLRPLLPDHPRIMYWRPQKVGSSSILSLLTSFGYRYNLLPKRKGSQTYMCRKMAKCSLEYFQIGKWSRAAVSENRPMRKNLGTSHREVNLDIIAETVGPISMSVGHEICDLDRSLVQDMIGFLLVFFCSFYSPPNTPLVLCMQVREPLKRAISVYYFWGELHLLKIKGKEMKMKKMKANREKEQRRLHGTQTSVLDSGRFEYHGNESTVPHEFVALNYARNIRYDAGMPGPSLTWSALAPSVTEAVKVVQNSDQIMTIVTERLDESLVVLSWYMGWSLADVVQVKPRKALSPHPGVEQWPDRAVKILQKKMAEYGEYQMYDAANQKLDERIKSLESGTWNQHEQGSIQTGKSKMTHKEEYVNNLEIQPKVDVEAEVNLLRALRARTSLLCDSEKYLVRYRDLMNNADGKVGLPLVIGNRFRESHDRYFDEGHQMAYNRGMYCCCFIDSACLISSSYSCSI